MNVPSSHITILLSGFHIPINFCGLEKTAILDLGGMNMAVIVSHLLDAAVQIVNFLHDCDCRLGTMRVENLKVWGERGRGGPLGHFIPRESRDVERMVCRTRGRLSVIVLNWHLTSLTSGMESHIKWEDSQVSKYLRASRVNKPKLFAIRPSCPCSMAPSYCSQISLGHWKDHACRSYTTRLSGSLLGSM
jgi:hypothetical protein